MRQQDIHVDGGADERLSAVWARAYGARTRDDLRRLYADWARTYDEDHRRVGFFAHQRTAEVLARHMTRHDVAQVMDAGAGTGAAGEALHARGFRNLVAVDLSEEMLEVAGGKGVYRETLAADLSMPLDAFAADSFDAAVLVGVFSYGQAPAETLDEVLRLVRIGGVVAFTMRTDFHEQGAMGVRARMEALERRGAWELLERTEPEAYLPGKDPDARFQVWCYRVTGRVDPEVEPGFEDAVREALESDAWVKKIDHAWIWDSTASRLYDRYTRTPGYYLTDCEEEILQDHSGTIVGGERLIVELGCGSARKIGHVLQAAVEARVDPAAEHGKRPGNGKHDPANGSTNGSRRGHGNGHVAGGAGADAGPVRYLPIDVSPGAVQATTAEVQKRFGGRVRVEPRQGLFEEVLPTLPVGEPKLVFFFGSSIGNLDTVADTVSFLRGLRERLHPGDRFVVGIDLHKDEDILERAYNEEEQCRSFFAHMLRRINEHFGADFDPRVFELSSTYEEEPPHQGLRTRRMSLRVAPTVPQHTWVRKLGLEVRLQQGQPVQVGISRKYEPAQVAELARMAGLRLTRQWFDRRRWFSLNEFVRDDAQ